MFSGNVRQQRLSTSLTVLTVLFGLQLIRVLLSLFVYYLRDSRGISAISLAPIAIGIFALSFLAAPLRRLVGLRSALAVTAGGVALLRFAEQVSFNSGLDLILAAAGVVLFAMFVPIALELARPTGAKGSSQFVLALLLGITADTALHTAVSTVDLSWHQGFLAALLVFLLAAVTLAILWFLIRSIEQETPESWGWARILALAAYGPWLFLQLVIFQNVARLATITGWSLPVTGLVIGLGNVIGLIAAAHAPRAKRIPSLTIFISIIFAILLLFAESTGLLGAVVSLVGLVLAASLMATIFISLGWLAGESGRMGAPAANGLGQLLFVILIFVFYVSFDMAIGFRAPAVLPVAGILVAIAAIAVTRGLADENEPAPDFGPAAIGGLLLLLPIGLWLTWSTPQPISPGAGNATIRVMDYNLHNGFNTDGQLNMEALAQEIEASGADVIGLQEVSRGWVINGSVDMMQWLSQRLNMPYVFGPTEGLQWGNAILSRYPIVSVETAPIPPDSLRFRRGYIQAEIDAGRGNVQIINTHLHHIEEDSQIRQQQVPVLLEAWGDAPNTILVGDLNATPDSPEMQMLARAGLVDIAAAIGTPPTFTYYSADPDGQIDYIWISPDLVPSDFEISQTTASDHLPLVSTITLP